MTETDLSSWLSIADAALVIGCSTRTVARLARAKQLEQRLRPQAGSPAVAVYNPEDVARLARERRPRPAPFVLPAVQTPTHRNGNGKGPTTSAIATVDQLPIDDPIRQLATAFHRFLLSPPSPPMAESRGGETLFLTLREASAVSGLSQAYLTRRIADKSLPAVRDRGWRIRRADLEQL